MPKVAAIQMCSTHDVDENLATASQLISQAAQQGAEFVVLPENFAIIGLLDTDKLKVKEAFGHGKIQDFLAQQAKQNHIWLVGGTIPIASSHSNRARAASLMFDASGNCVARYDKIHLFDVTVGVNETYQESNSIEPGNQIVVVDTPIGKVGMAVCYDVRFPELFRVLFNRGAEILLLPSAFTVPTGEAHWGILTRSRAIENFCYLIAPAQGGTHTSGRKTFGNSVIVHPWGNVLAQQTGTESGVIFADIDLQKEKEIRKAIPVAQHQKIFFDRRDLKFADE